MFSLRAIVLLESENVRRDWTIACGVDSQIPLGQVNAPMFMVGTKTDAGSGPSGGPAQSEYISMARSKGQTKQ